MSLPSLGVLTEVSIFANSVWLTGFLYDIGTRQKPVYLNSNMFFSYSHVLQTSPMKVLGYGFFTISALNSSQSLRLFTFSKCIKIAGLIMYFYPTTCPKMNKNSLLYWNVMGTLFTLLLNPISEYLSYQHKVWRFMLIVIWQNMFLFWGKNANSWGEIPVQTRLQENNAWLSLWFCLS